MEDKPEPLTHSGPSRSPDTIRAQPRCPRSSTRFRRLAPSVGSQVPLAGALLRFRLRQRMADRLNIPRPYQPCNLVAAAQEDQGRPEFDAERAAQRAARAVFDFHMTHPRMVGKRFAE